MIGMVDRSSYVLTDEPEGEKKLCRKNEVDGEDGAAGPPRATAIWSKGRIDDCWMNEESEGIGRAGMPWATAVFLDVQSIVERTISEASMVSMV
jgi:hypothetical protein